MATPVTVAAAMNDMIERVGRALFESWLVDFNHGGRVPPISWETCTAQDKQYAFKQARAAIAAMREPSEAMTDAGARGSGENSITAADGAWRAMIDEALK